MENSHTVLYLPDPKEIIERILSKKIESENISYSDWVNREINNISYSRNWPPNKIFALFTTSLLARQSYEGWWEKVKAWLEQEIIEIENLPEPSQISTKLEAFGYRFHPQGGKVLTKAKEIFKDKYNGNWNDYFNQADAKYIDDFQDDYFLKIKCVKFKVRDLALSWFSTKYVAIDSHVVDIIRRTGLVCYTYQLGLEMTTNPTIEHDYLSLRKLCVHLSETTGLQPREIDRLFWYYGKNICTGGNPKCENCAIKDLCLSYIQNPQHRI
jgi:endonuclease III